MGHCALRWTPQRGMCPMHYIYTPASHAGSDPGCLIGRSSAPPLINIKVKRGDAIGCAGGWSPRERREVEVGCGPGGWMEVVGWERGREEGGGALGEGDICSPCIFHKGEIERWEQTWKGEKERQAGKPLCWGGMRSSVCRRSGTDDTAFPVAPTGAQPLLPWCGCVWEPGCAVLACMCVRGHTATCCTGLWVHVWGG